MATGQFMQVMMEIWWFRLIIFALFTIAIFLTFYKDIKYWIKEHKKNKNKTVQRKKTSKGIVTISEGRPKRVNAVLYFFYVLFGVESFLVVILTLLEKFGLI